MVQDSGDRFEFRILDSKGNPLPEYPYPSPSNEPTTSEVYLQVPNASADQAFSILIKRVNICRPPKATYFFHPRYDGIPNATGKCLFFTEHGLIISEMGSKSIKGNSFAYHKMKFEKLPEGQEKDGGFEDFGKIQVMFYQISDKPAPAPEKVKKDAHNTHDIKNRKLPFSSIPQGTGREATASSSSSRSNTPMIFASGRRNRHQNTPVQIATGALTHNVGVGKWCYTRKADPPVQSIGRKYRVVFHYRSKEALHLLGIIPGPRHGGLKLGWAAAWEARYQFDNSVERVEKERAEMERDEIAVRRKRVENLRAMKERAEKRRAEKKRDAAGVESKEVEHCLVGDNGLVEVDSDAEALSKQLRDTMAEAARRLD